MIGAAHGPQRPIVVRAIRDLIDAARAERALLAIDAPERQFYLGVEAAAEEVLHPELTVARPPNWPEETTPAFREGYEQTAAELAAAVTMAEPPLHLRLPDARCAGQP